MKRAYTVLMGVTGVTAAGFLVFACGSTKSNDSDAGTGTGMMTTDASGASDVVAVDHFVPTVMDSATCDIGADLTAQIPDASLDDGGMHTTGICLGCVNKPMNCQAQVQACSNDCDCQGAVAMVIQCIAMGGNQLTCGSQVVGLPATAQNEGIALLTCIQSKCSNECIPAQFMDGGSTTDASDDAGDGS